MSRPLSWNIYQSSFFKKKNNRQMRYAMSQFTKLAQTNWMVSHFCKQICLADTWYYEKYICYEYLGFGPRNQIGKYSKENSCMLSANEKEILTHMNKTLFPKKIRKFRIVFKEKRMVYWGECLHRRIIVL